MDTQPAFGHRAPSSNRDAFQPLHIVKRFGYGLAPSLAVVLVIIALYRAPQLMGGSSISEVLLHSGGGAIDLFMIAIAIMISWLSNYPNVLDIDQSGVRVKMRWSQAFYEWGDIERVDVANRLARVCLVGRSSEQNACNVISGKFLDGPDAVKAAVEAGKTRWGAGRGPQAFPRPRATIFVERGCVRLV